MIPSTITTTSSSTTTTITVSSSCCCCCPRRGPGFGPCGNLRDALGFLRRRPVFLLASSLQLGSLPVLLFRRVVHVVLVPVPVLVLVPASMEDARGWEGKGE